MVHEIKYNGYAKIGLTLGKIMGAQIKNRVSQLDYFITVSLIEWKNVKEDLTNLGGLQEALHYIWISL